MTTTWHRPAWDPFRGMALRPELTAVVRVTAATVPAGGMMTIVATGFGTTGDLAVYLDHEWDHPAAVFGLDRSAAVHDRVPIPAGSRPGPHSLTFVSDLAEYDLLIDVSRAPTEVELESRRAVAGTAIEFTVRGFPAGEVAHVKLNDEGPATPFTVGVDGSGSGRFTVPDGTPPGHHHLRFLAPNPPTSALESFQVVD